MKPLYRSRVLPALLIFLMNATAVNAASPTSVNLGTAARFAVLAGSTITSTGNSTVNGDVGLSPGARSSITGFIGGGAPATPGIVNGSIFASDDASPTPAMLLQAKMDVTTAYNDAAGRTLAPVSVAGNLGGQTLSPGLYKSTSSLSVTSGDLTLDAGGDANAVFIFQMASTLTTTSGRRVILTGGAQACNIFWQVGTSATFGTTSEFAGTILADQSISLATGMTLNGRALARVGAVTMDNNTITRPACSGASSSSSSSVSSSSSSSSSNISSSVSSSNSHSSVSSSSRSSSSSLSSSSRSSMSSTPKAPVACVKLKGNDKRTCFTTVRKNCRMQYPAPQSGANFAACLRTGIRGMRK